MTIDHIGLVSTNAEIGELLELLGYRLAEEGESHGSTCKFYQSETGPGIEVVQPQDNDSLFRFTEKSPTALHHLAYRVDSLNQEIKRWQAKGYQAVTSDPQPGAKPGMRVIFLRPKRTEKMLIELVTYAQD